MNRKMRAKLANAEARARRDRPPRKSGIETGNALFVDRDDNPLGVAPILVDHDKRVFEIIPEKEQMN